MYVDEVIVEKEFSFLNHEQEMLAGKIVFPHNMTVPCPVVVLTHGFGSSKNGKTNTFATKFLVSRGIAVVRFDFSGHGDSGGDFTKLTISKAVQELKCSISNLTSIKEIDISRLGILGVSFGGNVAVLYASRYGGVNLLALKSPISNYKEVRERQLGLGGIKEWERKKVVDIGGGRYSEFGFYLDACRIDSYKEAEKVTCPVVIVQGNKDEVIPMRHTINLVRSFEHNNARLYVINGADHSYTRNQDFQDAMNKLVYFIASNL